MTFLYLELRAWAIPTSEEILDSKDDDCSFEKDPHYRSSQCMFRSNLPNNTYPCRKTKFSKLRVLL
jgi:hypothetical protein